MEHANDAAVARVIDTVLIHRFIVVSLSSWDARRQRALLLTRSELIIPLVINFQRLPDSLRHALPRQVSALVAGRPARRRPHTVHRAHLHELRVPIVINICDLRRLSPAHRPFRSLHCTRPTRTCATPPCTELRFLRSARSFFATVRVTCQTEETETLQRNRQNDRRVIDKGQRQTNRQRKRQNDRRSSNDRQTEHTHVTG